MYAPVPPPEADDAAADSAPNAVTPQPTLSTVAATTSYLTNRRSSHLLWGLTGSLFPRSGNANHLTAGPGRLPACEPSRRAHTGPVPGSVRRQTGEQHRE